MPADVNHLFVNPKADGPDGTITQPGDWNAAHKATGGADGQALVWDSSDANRNLGWGQFDHHNYVFNGDMELWGGGTAGVPSGWRQSGAGASFAREASLHRGGTYGLKVTRAGNNVIVMQDAMAVWNEIALFKGKTVTFGCWVKTAVGSAAKLGIDDGVTITSSSFHTGNDSYQFLKVTKTIAANATKCEVQLHLNVDGVAYYDNAILAFSNGSDLADFCPGLWKGRKCIYNFGSHTGQNQGSTNFYGPHGHSGTEVEVSFFMPFRGVARNMWVLVDAAPPSGQTIALVLRRDELNDSPLGCTVTSAARSANDTSNHIEIATSQGVSIKCTLSATTGARYVHGTFEYEEIPASF